MQTKRLRAAALITVAMIGLTACGSSGDSSNAGPTPKTPSATQSSGPGDASASPSPSESMDMSNMATITIKDFAYKGASTLSPGDMVHVTNDDSTAHTVTSDQSGAFDVTVDAGGDATFNAPSKPGKYPYHCTFHSDMAGTLVVK